MAVSGIILVLFLIAHMIGNLKVFFGAEAFNHYARLAARPSASRLLPPRTVAVDHPVVLLVVGGRAHRGPRSRCWRAGQARPPGQVRAPRRSAAQSYASRTMRWGGVIILLFIICHLLDLTTGTREPGRRRREPTTDVVADFPEPGTSRSFYIVAMLAARLPPAARLLERHRRPSAQSNRRRERDRQGRRHRASPSLLTAGFLLVPVAVLFGLVDWTGITDMPLELFTDGDPIADTKAPAGPDRRRVGRRRKFEVKLVNPANRRKFDGHRRRHRPGRRARRRRRSASSATTSKSSASRTARAARTSIAAQGGINAAKNYQNDGDSVYRLFYDTVKGGDFRAREANVYRLAAGQRQHHRPVRRAGRAVRARVRRPARQPLVRRRAGLAHVLRARPDRPAAAARRLPGARCGRSAPARSRCHPRTEMLDLVVVDGQARGIVARDLRHRRDRVARRPTPSCSPPAATATSSTSRPTPWTPTSPRPGARTSAGALLRQPLLHADPPDLHPGQRRLPVEAHADERVAAQRRPRLGAEEARATTAPPEQIPEAERDYYLERQYPSFGNLVPRDIASRNAKAVCDEGRGVGPSGLGVYLDFADAIERLGRDVDRGALRQPLRHVRADHRRGPVRGADAHLPGRPLHDGRAVGRLRPDEHDPRPVRARRGELLRPRRQPPRRQRADAGPGRRLLRPARTRSATTSPTRPLDAGRRPTTRRSSRPQAAVAGRASTQLLSINGTRTRRLVPPRARQRSCGTTAAWRAPRRACARRSTEIRALRDEFWQQRARCSATDDEPEPVAREGRPRRRLPRARRADVPRRAAPRRSPAAATSARSTRPTDGEALRDDEHFAYVAAWEWTRRRRRAARAAQGAARVRVRRSSTQRSYK